MKVLIALAFVSALQVSTAQESTSQEKTQSGLSDKDSKTSWNPFFPEKELVGWEPSDFYENGKVSRTDRGFLLEEGKPLTGITYSGKPEFPLSNYEISLEARRIKGNDFLCGLTFPVGKGFCTYIAGGWGGGLVGLSSVDGSDASENATTTFHDFENGKWYRFRVSVDDEFIRCWIDDEQVVTQEREHHEFSTRIEVHASQPLGFCVFRSVVEVRDFQWRSLSTEKARETVPNSVEKNGAEK